VSRIQTPRALWLMDRWFRIPDAISDWIEYRLPATSPLTRLPCLMYSRWYSELVMRQVMTEWDAVARPAPDAQSDSSETSA
jgi:hypothetical protein